MLCLRISSMVFSSLVFISLFLPLTLACYYLVPRFLRNTVLLLASLLFYAWGETFYVVIMLISIAMNYVFGLAVSRLRGRPAATSAVAIAVFFNLGLLGVFKYANFIVDNINACLGGWLIPAIELQPVHLPIGISFFTFQALSYVLDVHRQDARAQHNPLRLALYVALFPQLIAGPIVRYQHIEDQISARKTSVEMIARGIRRFLIGLAKKVLLANTFAFPADEIFNLPADALTASVAWFGVICYTLQIYFDFSGYSDMAIGLGRMFGFEFRENFQWPYVSKSIREFWRRWHISLSTWFRDYLYIPLGGNQRGALRTYLNLLIVFFLCGLWHGASWTFVFWGLYHGLFLVLERTRFSRFLEVLPAPMRHGYVLVVVAGGWVLFRAETLEQAINFYKAMMGIPGANPWPELLWRYLRGDILIAFAAGLIGATPFLPKLRGWVRDWQERSVRWVPYRMATVGTVSVSAYLLLLVGCVMSLVAGTHNPFIYFRF